jgi:hydroxymethylglutaryl-CoA synthase
MTDVGVLGVGTYAPDRRIAAEEFEAAMDSFQGSGIQEKAVPAPDEDIVTMAYEAGTRALDAAGVAPGDIGNLSLATTNSPVDEEDALAHLGAMFGVDEGAASELHGGSTVAGLRALRSAVQTSRDAGPALVVASDAPQGEPNSTVEHAAGASAAAFVVGQGGRVDVADMAASAEPASGVRFRRRGKEATESLGITAFDRKVFRETVTDAVDSLMVEVDDVDAASIQAPDGAAPYRVASAAGVDASRVKQGVTVHELGDT